ncbi:hypothetical protein QQ054_22680 [Oscillatoria amoena NRMC-F 0135]|nr:hypothetical protein [Oscillatoria amoena NRMC-F 0135]
MKKLVFAMLIGIMGIANLATAQVRPGIDNRQAALTAHQARLRQADLSQHWIVQPRWNQQRLEQLRIKQARIKHDRVKKHRVKHARIKDARIKAAREDAANDGVTRRRYEQAKKKRVRLAGTTGSE